MKMHYTIDEVHARVETLDIFATPDYRILEYLRGCLAKGTFGDVRLINDEIVVALTEIKLGKKGDWHTAYLDVNMCSVGEIKNMEYLCEIV